MKKTYEAPEFELIRYSFKDVILTSPTESLPIQIETEGGDIDLDL